MERSLARLIAAAIGATALGTMLGGCSDIYTDRRATLALGAGDAIAANEVAQTIDPWPAQSGNTNIAANGQKMQSAVERYRTNNVVPPVDPLALENAIPSTPTPQSNTNSSSTPAVPSIAPGTTSTTTTVVTAAPPPAQ